MRYLVSVLKSTGSGALVLSLMGVLACNNTSPTIIHYQQIANSDLWDSNPSGSPHDTSGAGESLFLITEISTPAQGETLNFTPKRLYISDPNDGGWTQTWAYLIDSSVKAMDVTIAPGASKMNLGCVAVPTDRPASNDILHLFYDSTATESVLLARDGDPSAPVQDVQFSPDEIKQLCTP
jgi:hypothetical protein